jgi:hypothetical protein
VPLLGLNTGQPQASPTLGHHALEGLLENLSPRQVERYYGRLHPTTGSLRNSPYSNGGAHNAAPDMTSPRSSES